MKSSSQSRIVELRIPTSCLAVYCLPIHTFAMQPLKIITHTTSFKYSPQPSSKCLRHANFSFSLSPPSYSLPIFCIKSSLHKYRSYQFLNLNKHLLTLRSQTIWLQTGIDLWRTLSTGLSMGENIDHKIWRLTSWRMSCMRLQMSGLRVVKCKSRTHDEPWIFYIGIWPHAWTTLRSRTHEPLLIPL